MTDPDERTINRAIALVSDSNTDEREEARAALHRLFRDRRRLEAEVERLREDRDAWKGGYNRQHLLYDDEHKQNERLREERDEANRRVGVCCGQPTEEKA